MYFLAFRFWNLHSLRNRIHYGLFQVGIKPWFLSGWGKEEDGNHWQPCQAFSGTGGCGRYHRGPRPGPAVRRKCIVPWMFTVSCDRYFPYSCTSNEKTRPITLQNSWCQMLKEWIIMHSVLRLRNEFGNRKIVILFEAEARIVFSINSRTVLRSIQPPIQ